VTVPLALTAEGVTKTFGDTRALADVSLTVGAAECVALVGESGSGKSTLLRAFNRLTTIDAGRVLVNGIDVRTTDPVMLRRHMGYVPQNGGLLPHWTVQRNTELVPTLLGLPDAALRAREALADVGLSPSAFAARFPRELSGGQRQRVSFARALAASPNIVLLDEPFGALDAITRSDVHTVFARVREARGAAALLITHDLPEAFRLAHRVAVMRAGRIEQLGTPRQMLDAPATEYVAALLERSRVRTEWLA
jgi:osmoprotectant transport system ATP-binding protein